MSNVAIISIKPEYSNKILSHSKTIELRHSSLGLAKSDILIVYESAPKQALGFWFRVAEIETLSVDEMWMKHGGKLGIDRDSYLTYFDGHAQATGLHISELHQLDPAIPLTKIIEVVPHFVPPQGIVWLRDNIGRFRKLLNAISPPLPANAFSQLSLFGDLSSTGRRARPATADANELPY